MSPVLQNETEVNCTAEIAGSVEQLAWILGHPVRYFAYPNGRPNIDFGEREKRILEKANITMAFSTEPDTLCGNTDLLSVPRMSFAGWDWSLQTPVFLRLNLGKTGSISGPLVNPLNMRYVKTPVDRIRLQRDTDTRYQIDYKTALSMSLLAKP